MTISKKKLGEIICRPNEQFEEYLSLIIFSKRPWKIQNTNIHLLIEKLGLNGDSSTSDQQSKLLNLEDGNESFGTIFFREVVSIQSMENSFTSKHHLKDQEFDAYYGFDPGGDRTAQSARFIRTSETNYNGTDYKLGEKGFRTITPGMLNDFTSKTQDSRQMEIQKSFPLK
jgi:hypothetical protein